MPRLALATAALLLAVAAPAAAQIPVGPQTGFPLTRVAGTGQSIDTPDFAPRGDGGPALEAAFDGVDGLDLAGDGSILVADSWDGRIRRITPAGTIVTNRDDDVDAPGAVVGIGWYPTDPQQRHSVAVADNGADAVTTHQLLTDQATWSVSTPMEDLDAADIERSASGYWVADPWNGTVHHLSFIGAPTFAWQHPAVMEDLNEPRGVGPLPGGGVLVVDEGDHCQVYRYKDGGTTRVAGARNPGTDEPLCAGGFVNGPAPGDGGPATQGLLFRPSDVEATPDGGFVIAEAGRLRRFDAAGTISTLLWVPRLLPEQAVEEVTALDVAPDGDVLFGMRRQVWRLDTNFAPPPDPQPQPPAPQPPAPQPQPAAPGTPQPPAALATLSRDAYTLKRGKALKLGFTAPLGGRWTLQIRKQKQVLVRRKGAARTGANTVKLTPKLRKGRYALTLAVSAGGRTTKDTAILRVT